MERWTTSSQRSKVKNVLNQEQRKKEEADFDLYNDKRSQKGIMLTYRLTKETW